MQTSLCRSYPADDSPFVSLPGRRVAPPGVMPFADSAGDSPAIVGQSPAMRHVVEQIQQVAATDSTVLLLGETGTGKELLASEIHKLSARRGRGMVRVNCAAIPGTLIESELFGREKGAYTGALARQIGRFELADHSTLFLDEIGDLPVALQVKLLRALQEGEVRRVGANTSTQVDVRLITATNRDLAADIASGRFRGDLYYRINVVTIKLPPLRERPQDIPELALHFLRRYNERLGLGVEGIAPAAMRLLADYAWPGNVRELENVIERALVLAQGSTIEPEHLADFVHGGETVGPSADDLSIKRQTLQLERNLIRRALEQTRGNRTRAAQLLELSHRALLYKIRDYQLGE
jgi:two-component system response regulator AtoC